MFIYLNNSNNNIKMIKNILLTICLAISLYAQAQTANNNLNGYYTAQSDTLMYSYFSFDGNGKVDIMGMGEGEFFTNGDSLIVFPDKSIFNFKIEGNKLIGTSDWVKDGVWVKQDSTVESKRKDDTLAQHQAELLNEYYQKTRMNGTDLTMLFDDKLMHEYTNTLQDLCNKGLPKACMELFGVKLMNEMGGISAVLIPQKNLKVTENPELIKLANKIIEMGEKDGHMLLGSYLYSIGQKEKGNREIEKAIDLGSKKAALLQLNMSLENETTKE